MSRVQRDPSAGDHLVRLGTLNDGRLDLKAVPGRGLMGEGSAAAAGQTRRDSYRWLRASQAMSTAKEATIRARVNAATGAATPGGTIGTRQTSRAIP